MKGIFKLLIPFSFVAVMSGCVVAPYGYHRGYYYHPRAVLVAPAPAVIIRP